MNLTDAQIAGAIEAVRRPQSNHEHADCVRIAYEWLDAQVKTKGPRQVFHPLKHLIENWGGRYVSQTDVEAAAHLHPGILGKYPAYNISSRLTEPRVARLEGIGRAFSQGQRERHNPKAYARQE